MDGLANMRVHANLNYSNTNYALRLTDIYIVKVGQECARDETYLNPLLLLHSATIGMPPMALTTQTSHALPSNWPAVHRWLCYHS